jgi:1-acyl-sn-glycerol-3-phosphate acyltransferase
MKSEKQSDSPFSEAEIDAVIEKCRAVTTVGEMTSERVYALIKRYFAPTVVGLENIPDEPTLFVGNHSLLGLDGWILIPTLYHETGRFVRTMGDNAWLQIPGVGDRLIKNGMILAHPRACSATMQDGHDLLVFPGGAAEANKTAAQKYSLQWRERYGFVRVAAENGYNVTPFGLVGPDDFYDHWIEGNELLETRLGRLLTRMGVNTEAMRKDLFPPIPSGLFASLLPKPQRCFLALGQVIEVPDFTGKTVPESVQKSIREKIAGKIDDLIRDMLLLRAQQKQDEGWLRRFLTR